MINKNFYRKTNDKKILHKVGKQWKVVSVALLMAIGGGAAVAATNNNANADVNVNNAAEVKNEANQLENDTFTPTSVSASSSVASKSTAAPSLASYNYAPSARVNGRNASAAYYNNHYDFDQQEVSYYGPTVKSYVNSINARFPEAKNLQSSYNSATNSASAAKSSANSFSAAANNPANKSFVSEMASSAGLTTSDFIDSVQYRQSSYASDVSEGSNEDSAINFVNGIVSEILNGNPQLSADNASADATLGSANLSNAVAVSSADQRNISAVSSANSVNESILNSAVSQSRAASLNAEIAERFSDIDVATTESAAKIASNTSSYANSSAVSSAISALASVANSSALSIGGNNAQFKFNNSNNTQYVQVTPVNAGDAYDAAYDTTVDANKNIHLKDTKVALSVGSYALNDDANSADMVRVISDTAAQSAEASVSASANSVIASAKAYKSAHASDMSSASAQANSDSSAVASASDAYAMDLANSLISSTIASGVGTNGSTAVAYINGLLDGQYGNIGDYFDSVAVKDNFGGQSAEASIYNSMLNSASQAKTSTAAAVGKTNPTNDNTDAIAANDVYTLLTNYSAAADNNNNNIPVSSLYSQAYNSNAEQAGLSGNDAALTEFNSLAKHYNLSNTTSLLNSGDIESAVPTEADEDNKVGADSEITEINKAQADPNNTTVAKFQAAVAADNSVKGAGAAAVKGIVANPKADTNPSDSTDTKKINNIVSQAKNEANSLDNAKDGTAYGANAMALNNMISDAYQIAINSDNGDVNDVYNNAVAYNDYTSASVAYDTISAAQNYNGLTGDYKTTADTDANNAESSAFNSAALASGSAKGVDFSILTKANGAFHSYGVAVQSYENSLANLTGNSKVASNTSANLSEGMSLAQSSADSSYAAVQASSGKYYHDMHADVTLASYFASSFNSDASSEANLATSASNALNSYYIAKANSSEFTTAFNDYNFASNAMNGDKTLAHANGIYVLHNSPQFITLTKNAELHDAVLFNKKTALRSAKAGEQFAVKGVAFDKVGTLRYIVGTTKDGGYVYVTANDSYVENSYLEPDGNYTVKLLHGANVHATKNFSSKVIKHLPAGTEFTGQAVPTLNVDHTYNYYEGVSRLAAFGGYVTANVNVVQNMPQNNNNNNSSAAANNQKPAGNPANLVLFK